MRKFLSILLVIVAFGCEKDDFDMDKYMYEHYLKEYAEYIQSFKIKDTTGLKITNFGDVQGDISAVMFSGIRKGKLWFGKFDKETREQVYEWNDTEYLPQNRDKCLPDGTTKNIPIKYALIGGPLTTIGDSYVFIVYSGSNLIYSTPYTTDFYDLYFLKGDQIIKHQGITEVYTQIRPWATGTIITEGYPWCCFSLTGEKLYSFHEGVSAGTPINIEECINATLAGLKRVNLKTGEIKWLTGKIYEDIPLTAQSLMYRDKIKDDVTWTYALMILDGLNIKETRTFDINIETGKITY